MTKAFPQNSFLTEQDIALLATALGLLTPRRVKRMDIEKAVSYAACDKLALTWWKI